MGDGGGSGGSPLLVDDADLISLQLGLFVSRGGALLTMRFKIPVAVGRESTSSGLDPMVHAEGGPF